MYHCCILVNTVSNGSLMVQYLGSKSENQIMMKTNSRHVCVLLMTVFLAGCATSKPVGINDRLLDYYVNDVSVSFADKVDLGVFERMDNEDDRDFVERVGNAIERTVFDSIEDTLDGTRPVDIAITLTEVDIASEAGRVLFASDSSITGIVEITDGDSGDVLAERAIQGSDSALSMGGNIGGLISLVTNITDAATTDRITEVVGDFSARLREWIEN